MIPDETYAKLGYEEYAVSTGGKTFDGRDMPKWDDLPARIKDAWLAATDAVLNHHEETCSTSLGQVEVSADELHVLDHTTAWRRGRYRNHFVTGHDTDDYPVLVCLVEKGLMRRGESSDALGGMTTFAATDAGFAFLRKALP